MTLENKLNKAHKEYLAVCKNIKSKEYKNAKEKYLTLAEEYKKQVRKEIKNA